MSKRQQLAGASKPTLIVGLIVSVGIYLILSLAWFPIGFIVGLFVGVAIMAVFVAVAINKTQRADK